MFLNDLLKPTIAFNSSGGGGGGGSSNSGGSSSKTKSSPKPAEKSSSGGKGGKTATTSTKSSAPKTSPRPVARPTTPAPSAAPKPATDPRAAAYKQYADSMKAANIMTLGGKQTPAEPYNAGNPAIFSTNSRGSKVIGALDPSKPPSMATNKDGSLYVPYNGKDAHNPNAVSKNNPTGATITRSTIPDNEKAVKHVADTAAKVDAYNAVTAPAPDRAPDTAPVTSPEPTDPRDGVGGGRDGGGSAKRSASKTVEDKITVRRKAEGVDRYKVRKDANGAPQNPMAINRRAANTK